MIKDNDYVNKRFGILDYAPSGIFVLDKEYQVIFWNQCIAEWTGVDAVNIVGKDIRTVYRHLGEPEYQDRIDTIFSGGLPAVFSSQLHAEFIPCTLPNGSVRIQKTIVTPVPSASGGELFALFSIEDVSALSSRVSDFKKMRDKALNEVRQREKTEEQLKTQNKVLNSVLSASPVGIAFIENYRLEWVNEVFCEIFGRESEDDFKGHLIEEFYASPEEYVRVGKEILLKAPENKIIEVDAEFKKNSGTFKGHIMMTCLDKDDLFKRIIVSVFDLTEKNKAENAKMQTKKLQGVLETAGAVCHEMNQPIMAIIGYSELLMSSVPPGEPVYDKIKKIYEQSKRTGEITRKLMGLTRYETKDYADGEKIVDLDIS